MCVEGAALEARAAPSERPVSDPGEIQEKAKRNSFTDGITNVPEGKKEHS